MFRFKFRANEIIVKQAASMTRQAIPDVDPSVFEDLHCEFLTEKEQIIESGVQGEELAHQINELSFRFQRSLAERLSAEQYEKLTGMKPGEVVRIVDPNIAKKND
ncbi:MAG: hypothetical protein C4527_08065 [Candidatus Omnitrophota bacterium]|jgi:hypothetical protein|nr:MAG: hypothetical protein C4527_08065 [Candidatus Omnitrophota bacterium]